MTFSNLYKNTVIKKPKFFLKESVAGQASETGQRSSSRVAVKSIGRDEGGKDVRNRLLKYYSAAPKVLSVFNQIDDGIQTNKTNKMKRNERNETKQTTGEDTYGGGGPPPRAGSPARSFGFILFVLFV